jgi:hypothetical protein
MLYKNTHNVKESEIWETYLMQHTFVIMSSVYFLIWSDDGWLFQPKYAAKLFVILHQEQELH